MRQCAPALTRRRRRRRRRPQAGQPDLAAALPSAVAAAATARGAPRPPGGTPLAHFLALFLEALRRDSPTLAAAVRALTRSWVAFRILHPPSHFATARRPAARRQLRARYERALACDAALEAALDRAEAARWPELHADAAGAGGPFGGGGLGALLAQLAA